MNNTRKNCPIFNYKIFDKRLTFTKILQNCQVFDTCDYRGNFQESTLFITALNINVWQLSCATDIYTMKSVKQTVYAMKENFPTINYQGVTALLCVFLFPICPMIFNNISFYFCL